MRAEDLQLDEIVTIAEGDISFQGRRLVLHSLHAMGQLRGDLVRMVGPEHARRIFTRFGYFHGQAGAAVRQAVASTAGVEAIPSSTILATVLLAVPVEVA